jgi:hypothetical protein
MTVLLFDNQLSGEPAARRQHVLYAIEVTDGTNGGTYDANLGLTSMFSVEFFA